MDRLNSDPPPAPVIENKLLAARARYDVAKRDRDRAIREAIEAGLSERRIGALIGARADEERAFILLGQDRPGDGEGYPVAVYTADQAAACKADRDHRQSVNRNAHYYILDKKLNPKADPFPSPTPTRRTVPMNDEREPTAQDVIDATPAYFREQGRMFGYPPCCVEAFVADVGAGRNPAELRGVDGKNGCVPCAACASTQGWEIEEPPSSEEEG